MGALGEEGARGRGVGVRRNVVKGGGVGWVTKKGGTRIRWPGQHRGFKLFGGGSRSRGRPRRGGGGGGGFAKNRWVGWSHAGAVVGGSTVVGEEFAGKVGRSYRVGEQGEVQRGEGGRKGSRHASDKCLMGKKKKKKKKQKKKKKKKKKKRGKTSKINSNVVTPLFFGFHLSPLQKGIAKKKEKRKRSNEKKKEVRGKKNTSLKKTVRKNSNVQKLTSLPCPRVVRHSWSQTGGWGNWRGPAARMGGGDRKKRKRFPTGNNPCYDIHLSNINNESETWGNISMEKVFLLRHGLGPENGRAGPTQEPGRGGNKVHDPLPGRLLTHCGGFSEILMSAHSLQFFVGYFLLPAGSLTPKIAMWHVVVGFLIRPEKRRHSLH